jgi:hypothetical protein
MITKNLLAGDIVTSEPAADLTATAKLAASKLYHHVDEVLRELINRKLNTRLPFRVELWDRSGQHVRWVIARSSSVAAGHEALDAAIEVCPDQRYTLCNGIQVIREHNPHSQIDLD